MLLPPRCASRYGAACSPSPELVAGTLLRTRAARAAGPPSAVVPPARGPSLQPSADPSARSNQGMPQELPCARTKTSIQGVLLGDVVPLVGPSVLVPEPPPVPAGGPLGLSLLASSEGLF